MATQIVMPQLGESVVEGTVTRWLRKEGESIQEYESLLEVNTDKVDTEIPSPASGTILKILVPEGETVRAGTVLALVGEAGESIPAQEEQPAEPAAPEVSSPGAEKSAQAIQETADIPTRPMNVEPGSVTVPSPGRSRELGFISPIVARMAQEHNLDLTQISGTGEGGRITKKDVQAYLEQAQAQPAAGKEKEAGPAVVFPWETPGEGDLFRPSEMVFGVKKQGDNHQPAADPPKLEETSPLRTAETASAPTPEGRLIPHSTIRRRIAEHMVQSVRTSPHVTTVMEADLHRVVQHYTTHKPLLARDGVNLTYTAYFAAATVQALKAHPLVNSSWTDDGILLHPQVNLGMAVSLGEEGLIVPVIRGAEGYSLIGLARAITDLASRARAHKLQPDEIRGGTFTITNHGISGSLFANPIINQPQCAILGVGAIQKRVIVTADDAIAVRPMVYLSLTFDHRILDGASADGFLSKVIEELENWK